MARSVPMRRVANRARKSAPPQVSAVRRPSRIPMDGLPGLAFFDFEAEHGHHFLKIFPDFTFRGWIAQQISRMIRCQQFSSAEFQPLSAKLRNSAVGLQQRFRGNRTEADNYFRSDGIDLPQKKWRTGADFIFLRL